MKIFFKQPTFDSQLLRVLAHTYYGCADICECLTTAHKIPEGDFDAWHDQWRRTADARFSEAEAAEVQGNTVCAKNAYLRASNYYRTATFFDYHPEPKERLKETFALHTEAFKRAAKLFSPSLRPVKIRYENGVLPGYFYKAEGSSRKPKPTIIFNSGYNSCHQEAYFNFVQSAQKHGYHTLAFDGPGQGSLLINDNIPMRHDWEKIITPVVDYLQAKKEVDSDKIILIGQSWGGLLAPRAAAEERRIAALVLNPGQYDAMENLKRIAADADPDTNVSGTDYHKTLEAFLQAAMKDKFVAAKFLAKMFVHGVETPSQLFEEWEKYSLAEVVEKIRCPTLVCDSENDQLTAPQAKTLYEALKCPKKYLLFTSSEGGGDHCAAGASALFSYHLFDWLEKVFNTPKIADEAPAPSAVKELPETQQELFALS